MDRAELSAVLRATGCAEDRGDFVFMTDPYRGAAERARVEALTAEADGLAATAGDGWLCVPTGGTSGSVRFARHDERTVTAAVEGFCAHFGIDRVNAVGVLPAHHVSGLMARVRCAATGGAHVAWDWKRLEGGAWPELARGRGDWVISLVPTQLQRLLVSVAAVAWLRGFRVIFIGGGPVWPELTDAAARAGLPVSLSYGMTETAAMVAALRPEEFLAGGRSSGAVMPHARIALAADGLVSIEGGSVFRGYFPETRAVRRFETEDIGRFDERGRLHLLGRRDATIITGGKKVWPAEVEAALRASGEFADVAIVGVPDAEWGEAVVACYPAKPAAPDFGRVAADLESLAAFKRPKRYVAIADWPRNAQGKVNRVALRTAALGGPGQPNVDRVS
jgi:O-succinylbenzoic acid--CoA ligase